MAVDSQGASVGAGSGVFCGDAAGCGDPRQSAAHWPAHRVADGGAVAVGAGDSGAGQPARFPGDGGVRGGDADRQLRAIPGAVDCDHGVDPRGSGHRGRAHRANRADPAHRAVDQCVADRWPGGAGLFAVALVAGVVPH